jgi:hypothetical protein
MDDARSKEVQEFVFALVAVRNQDWLSLQELFIQEPVYQPLNRPWAVTLWLLDGGSPPWRQCRLSNLRSLLSSLTATTFDLVKHAKKAFKEYLDDECGNMEHQSP